MAFDTQKLKEFFTFRKIGEQGQPVDDTMKSSTGNYEVNLLPEVKLEMIHRQKMRNLVLFIAIVVCAASIGVVGILGMVKAGQDITMSNQDNDLKSKSAQLMGKKNLTDVLTVQDQLNKISEIEDHKNVLSRVFSILTVLLPSGADHISLSELNVNLDTTTLSFNAQADAGVEPLIDYRVLESFIKSVKNMKYDYGRYVTSNGVEIPSRCIEEVDEDGNQYIDEETGAVYAKWKRELRSCRVDMSEEDEQKATDSDNNNGNTLNSISLNGSGLGLNTDMDLNKTNVDEDEDTNDTATDWKEDKIIWRTPRFDEWKEKGYIDLNGKISGIEHFESKCISYSGVESDGKVKWSADNKCALAPEGVEVSNSSNGRDVSGNLVLRFTASVKIDQGVFAYNNKHVMGIGPFGQNVTDSYIQADEIFVAPAKDCENGDTDCLNNKENSAGSKNTGE